MAAFVPDQGGVVSAGGVGFDISCGVRLLTSGLPASDLEPCKVAFADSLFREIPAGVGSRGKLSLRQGEIDEMLAGGAEWAIRQGYGHCVDLDRIEERGRMFGARPEWISDRARQLADTVRRVAQHLRARNSCYPRQPAQPVHSPERCQRAYGPGHPDLCEPLQTVGQPALIGGSMGTGSYVLAGSMESERRAFSSAFHGAGRSLSRHAALKRYHGREIVDALAREGVIIRSPSMRGVAEEAPGAYKDVDAVVDAADRAGLARKIARLRPLICLSG